LNVVANQGNAACLAQHSRTTYLQVFNVFAKEANGGWLALAWFDTTLKNHLFGSRLLLHMSMF